MSGEFKVFVSNISYNCTEDEFRTFIVSQDTSGTITEVRLGQLSQKRPDGQVSLRNKGYGFVTFNDEAVSNNFINNDQIMFDGRRLKFTVYTNQQKYYKLHVSNIPEALSISELTTLFSKYGTLDSVKKDYDFQTKTFKGTGEVVYTNYDDFGRVLAMKEVPIVEGLTLTVTKRYKLTNRKFQPRQYFDNRKKLSITRPVVV